MIKYSKLYFQLGLSYLIKANTGTAEPGGLGGPRPPHFFKEKY